MKVISNILSSIEGLIRESENKAKEWQESATIPLSHQTPSKAKDSGQAPVLAPRTYEALGWEEKLNGGYKVKFRTGTKLITIFRFLLAKIVFDTEDGLRLDEYLALMEAYLRLRSHKDPTFQAKYGEWLITIQPFLASLAGVKVFPLVPKKRSPELERALSPLLPSPSAYFGYKGNPKIRQGFTLVVRNPFIPPNRLPPPRFIGVGYKDKGTRRNTAVDGSPRWQDVAARIPTTDTPTFECSQVQPDTELSPSEFTVILKDHLTNFN